MTKSVKPPKFLKEARIKQAETAARLNEIRAEELSKQRIPLKIVLDTMDEIFGSIGRTIIAPLNAVQRIGKVTELLLCSLLAAKLRQDARG